MLLKENRIGSVSKVYRRDNRLKGNKIIRYVHKCITCDKKLYKNATEEKISTGYCIKCVQTHIRSKREKFNKKGNKQCSICKMYLPTSNYLKNKKKNIFGAACTKCENLKRFGITHLDYKKMLKEQNGVCAICREKEKTKSNKNNKVMSLSLDHDHKTGRVRGLLCGDCNRSIGLIKENIKSLKNAIKYITKHAKT